MTHPRCTTCNAILLWANHRLICPRPHCPGHSETTHKGGTQCTGTQDVQSAVDLSPPEVRKVAADGS